MARNRSLLWSPLTMTDTAYDWNPAAFGEWARTHRHEIRDFMRQARHRARHGGPPPFGRGAPFGPGQGFPFGGPWFGGGRRAGRGDIRAAILALLAEQPMHGYQIIQELERRSDGA